MMTDRSFLERARDRWNDYKIRRAIRIQDRADDRGHPVTNVVIGAALFIAGLGTYHLLREPIDNIFKEKPVDVIDNDEIDDKETDTIVIDGKVLTDTDIIKLSNTQHAQLSKIKGFEAIEESDVLALVYLMNVNNINEDETQDLIDAGVISDLTKEVFNKATGVFTAISNHNAVLSPDYTGKTISDVSTKYIGFAQFVIGDNQDKDALIDHDQYMMQLIIESDKSKAEAMAIEYINFITNKKVDSFEVTKLELGPLVRFIIQDQAKDIFTTSLKLSEAVDQNLLYNANLHQDILEYVDANQCLIKGKTK